MFVQSVTITLGISVCACSGVGSVVAVAATLLRPKKWPMLCNSELEIVTSSQTLERNLLETEPAATTSLVPCLMAGDETARLAHALDAHVYFFEVLVFQQLSLSESLCFITLCHVLCCYFIFIIYQRLHFAEIGSETTSKKQNFPGGACPQTP